MSFSAQENTTAASRPCNVYRATHHRLSAVRFRSPPQRRAPVVTRLMRHPSPQSRGRGNPSLGLFMLRFDCAVWLMNGDMMQMMRRLEVEFSLSRDVSSEQGRRVVETIRIPGVCFRQVHVAGSRLPCVQYARYLNSIDHAVTIDLMGIICYCIPFGRRRMDRT